MEAKHGPTGQISRHDKTVAIVHADTKTADKAVAAHRTQLNSPPSLSCIRASAALSPCPVSRSCSSSTPCSTAALAWLHSQNSWLLLLNPQHSPLPHTQAAAGPAGPTALPHQQRSARLQHTKAPCSILNALTLPHTQAAAGPAGPAVLPHPQGCTANPACTAALHCGRLAVPDAAHALIEACLRGLPHHPRMCLRSWMNLTRRIWRGRAFVLRP
eukprot:1161979-Pelagomonas_calceolata.AAC.3